MEQPQVITRPVVTTPVMYAQQQEFYNPAPVQQYVVTQPVQPAFAAMAPQPAYMAAPPQQGYGGYAAY
eukprot:3409836-Rhodomonas_salina.1